MLPRTKLKKRSVSSRINIILIRVAMKKNSKKRAKHTRYFLTRKSVLSMIPTARLVVIMVLVVGKEGLISLASLVVSIIRGLKVLTSTTFLVDVADVPPHASVVGAIYR